MRKNSKKIYLFSIIFGLIFIYLFNIIILRPFPFFKVNYINSLDNFNSSPFLEKISFYEIDLDTENISNKIRTKLDANLNEDIFQKIKISTEITRELQSNSLGLEIKNIDNILSNEQKYLEICSESAKIFITLMSYLGEYSRILWTNGHTLAEVWDGKNWIMTDTLSNVYSLDNKNGNFLSFSETVKLFPNVNFKQISIKKYELYDYNSDREKLHNIIKNNNLIFLMSNQNVYSFDTTREKISRVINSFTLNNKFSGRQLLFKENTKKIGNVGLSILKRYLY